MGETGRAIWIGVDVGGTKVRAGALDAQGHMLSWASYPHHATPGQFHFVAEAAGNALSKAQLNWQDVAGMGVVVPALVDSSAGVVVHSANLGWHNLPLGAELHRRLGVPVVIDVDVNASAVAELAALPGGSVSPWLWIAVGTGIGASLILDQFGEPPACLLNVGHIAVPGEPLRCQCGESGCLETLASGWAIVRAARALIVTDSSHRLNARVATITGEDLAIAALDGDAISLEVLTAAGRACGSAVANLVNLLTPEGVGFGGGVIVPGSPYLAALIDAARSEIRPWVPDTLRFHCARLGEQAGVIGAVELARRRLGGRSASESVSNL